MKIAEINFLCVHKKLRSKKLAPVMIKEITRRVNLTKCWQAYFTSGSVFPSPFSNAPYYHRNLNVKKNIATGFSYLPKGKSMALHVKDSKVTHPDEICYKGTARLMTKKDVNAVYNLYVEQSKKYQVKFKYSQQEIGHLLLPIFDVVQTIVFEDEDGKVTDFVSFYNLPS